MGGQRRLVSAGRMATTNDIGEYRIFAVPPGQYYLSAPLRPMGMMGDSDDRSGYARSEERSGGKGCRSRGSTFT